MAVLRAEGLKKRYRKRWVVQGVSLEVHSGEVTGLLGPNGAGKTTTFYMIMGAIRPDGGRIFLDSEEITHLAMHRRARKGVTYLPQEPSVFRKLTVWENIYAVLQVLGIPREEAQRRTEEVMEQMGIAHLARQRANTLSGGERRRVEIARALAVRPKFLLLDEPFTGIDPKTRQELQDIILSLKDQAIGVLVTDHNVRETLEITDRAYIIYEGRILLSGSSEELVRDPLVRRIYLGERFRL